MAAPVELLAPDQQGCDAETYPDQQRQGDVIGVPVFVRRQTQSGHHEVIHQCGRTADRCAAQNDVAADDKRKPESGTDNSASRRQQGYSGVVADAEARLEGEQRYEMHRPDAAADHNGGGGQPRIAGGFAGLAGPGNERQRRVT